MITLSLDHEQAWELHAILAKQCSFCGGMPGILTRQTLDQLRDAFEKAMESAKATPPRQPWRVQQKQQRPESARQARQLDCWNAWQRLASDQRTINALSRTLLMPDDVARMTDAELQTVRGIGTRSVALIREFVPYRGQLIVDGEVID
jgi:hypothetical protein